MIPATTQRVTKQTRETVNQNIRESMEYRVAEHRQATPEQIDARLRELDEEWNTERTLQTNAATLALTGSVLALTVDRRWAILPMAVTGFLLQHAIQGWCPPLPILRRLGVRTPREIETERHALKVLRGDYQRVADSPDDNDITLDAILHAVDS